MFLAYIVLAVASAVTCDRETIRVWNDLIKGIHYGFIRLMWDFACIGGLRRPNASKPETTLGLNTDSNGVQDTPNLSHHLIRRSLRDCRIVNGTTVNGNSHRWTWVTAGEIDNWLHQYMSTPPNWENERTDEEVACLGMQMSSLPCSFVKAINVKGVEKCEDGLWDGYILMIEKGISWRWRCGEIAKGH